MLGVTDHLDEFSLLCFSAGELGELEGRAAESHVSACLVCKNTLRQIEELDSELRKLAKEGELEQELSTAGFPPGDPFRRRPAIAGRHSEAVGPAAIRASDAGLAFSGRLLDAVRDAAHPGSVLGKLELEDAEQRFGLYYGLQESGRRIAESPTKALDFAKAVLRIHAPSLSPDTHSAVEAILPWSAIQGQAHILAAQGELWLKEFSEAHSHLVAAYGALRQTGDETSLAVVELTESQRRFFLGEARQALSLARRARATFEERGLEDLSARAAVVEAMALVAGGELEAALPVYREALPIFERYELWSNYVGGVNSLATALYKLGRLDEARREFARALRRFSRDRHRSWQGYLQHGLGDILLSAGRFRDAAVSFVRASQHFEECGLRASALLATLAEAESWARHGSVGRAKERLDLVARLVEGDPSLDRAVRLAVTRALSSARTESEDIAVLRQEVHSLLS
jgi:tetratricopeptide (TPR) repeat protein